VALYTVTLQLVFITVTAKMMRWCLFSDSEDTDALACASDGILTLHIQQKVCSEVKLCVSNDFIPIGRWLLFYSTSPAEYVHLSFPQNSLIYCK